MRKQNIYILAVGVALAILLVFFWRNPENPVSAAQSNQLENVNKALKTQQEIHIRLTSDKLLLNNRPVDLASLGTEMKQITETGEYGDVLIHISAATPSAKLEEISRLMQSLQTDYRVEKK
ncbi:hypothetical protein AB9P05_19005 [Roseivirga sp. BDSF3-8]|uniref:hypothetical protein n=1 Tax=Roseivirga sp. BDSF3-8 TaxID=3241598 RepID=UPI0035327364